MDSTPVALITGATQGIGHQIARELASQGFKVLVGARNLDAGVAAAWAIGGAAQAIQLDVTDQASILAASQQIQETLGRLDVLVNNAGIGHPAPPGTPLEEMRESGKMIRISIDDMRA